MSEKKLCIRIYPDGKIEVKTLNIKGKKCNNVLNVIEDIIPARIADSSYTPEYRKEEGVATLENNTLQGLREDL